jgi:putative SOS response-associated peptidase YedK
MCGRFVSTAGPDRIAAYFDTVVPTEVAQEVADGTGSESFHENYNVAPTQDVYAVVAASGDDGGAASTAAGQLTARVEAFHWGLVPSWAKDTKIASRMINARAETLAEKPAFKGLFAKRRCIVPMDGFYEWRPGSPDGPLNAKGKPLKQPLFIHRRDGEPLAVAALWTVWKDPSDPEGRFLHSTTLVTTAANDVMRPVHDRMPAVLVPEHWAEWLDPDNRDVEALARLLDGGPSDLLEMHTVSTDVNNVRNNRSELIEPS